MGSDLTALDGVDFVYIWLQGVGVLAVGFTLLTIAPTYIPAPEVSLYTLIETVLGPVWVYLGGYEAPSVFAVAGGAILLVALAVHRYYYCDSLYFYCNCNFYHCCYYVVWCLCAKRARDSRDRGWTSSKSSGTKTMQQQGSPVR